MRETKSPKINIELSAQKYCMYCSEEQGLKNIERPISAMPRLRRFCLSRPSFFPRESGRSNRRYARNALPLPLFITAPLKKVVIEKLPIDGGGGGRRVKYEVFFPVYVRNSCLALRRTRVYGQHFIRY